MTTENSNRLHVVEDFRDRSCQGARILRRLPAALPPRNPVQTEELCFVSSARVFSLKLYTANNEVLLAETPLRPGTLSCADDTASYRWLRECGSPLKSQVTAIIFNSQIVLEGEWHWICLRLFGQTGAQMG